jgi:hypothetical protein
VPASERNWAYQIGIGSSSWFLEAVILARLKRGQDAVEAAIRSTEMAPYDLYAHVRAAPLMYLTTNLGVAKAAYFDRVVRMQPKMLDRRAEAYA